MLTSFDRVNSNVPLNLAKKYIQCHMVVLFLDFRSTCKTRMCLNGYKGLQIVQFANRESPKCDVKLYKTSAIIDFFFCRLEHSLCRDSPSKPSPSCNEWNLGHHLPLLEDMSPHS